jgi:hypothetical protein
MTRKFSPYAKSTGTLFAILLAVTIYSARAKENQQTRMQDNGQSAPEPQQADGRRHGLPPETYAVAPGTKFLVVLEQDLTSRGTEENAKFIVRTVEPLEAGRGIYLPPGAEIHGHVSRIESAGTTGRAKIWLTFDDVYTKFGKLPIVAEVVSVPGDHSVKPAGVNQEGLSKDAVARNRMPPKPQPPALRVARFKACGTKTKKKPRKVQPSGP